MWRFGERVKLIPLRTIGFYFTNAWNSSYLPINSNASFDNAGKSFNVSKILGSNGLFDDEKYQQYSQPWMTAGFCCYLIWVSHQLHTTEAAADSYSISREQ